MSLAYTGSKAVAPPSSTAKRSSVIVPKIAGVRKTKRSPTPRLASVIRCGLTGSGRVCRRAIKTQQTSPATTLNAYTDAAPRVAAMTNPPAAGPSAAESWKLALLHATASVRRWRGTSCGRNAPPESTRYTHGNRFWLAISCARRCFFTVTG